MLRLLFYLCGVFLLCFIDLSVKGITLSRERELKGATMLYHAAFCFFSSFVFLSFQIYSGASSTSTSMGLEDARAKKAEQLLTTDLMAKTFRV